jgi:hypothetical protein
VLLSPTDSFWCSFVIFSSHIQKSLKNYKFPSVVCALPCVCPVLSRRHRCPTPTSFSCLCACASVSGPCGAASSASQRPPLARFRGGLFIFFFLPFGWALFPGVRLVVSRPCLPSCVFSPRWHASRVSVALHCAEEGRRPARRREQGENPWAPRGEGRRSALLWPLLLAPSVRSSMNHWEHRESQALGEGRGGEGRGGAGSREGHRAERTADERDTRTTAPLGQSTTDTRALSLYFVRLSCSFDFPLLVALMNEPHEFLVLQLMHVGQSRVDCQSVECWREPHS